MVWRRRDSTQPFGSREFIAPPGLPPLFGRSPRYIAATKELFFAKGVDPDDYGLWCVKNFDPSLADAVRGDEPGKRSDVGSKSMSVALPHAELISIRQIWNKAPHNAFTDLIRHQRRWFCTFREGKTRASSDGVLRVISSEDAKNWESTATIVLKTADLRDPKLTETPGGKLMLNAAATSNFGE